jgi:LAO/AO transport system kinase
MATRGNLGGLARATADVVKILDAFGKDWIIVETVGVGQDEVDIARTADTTVVVLAPGLGDTIQTMKAGVMEIANLYVVNKADRFGADELVNEIHGRLEQDSHFKKSPWLIPILKTVAIENRGTEFLVNAIQEHRNFLQESGELQKQRREKARQETLCLLKEEISRNVLEKVLGNGLFEDLVDDIVAHRSDPYTSVQDIIGTIFPED